MLGCLEFGCSFNQPLEDVLPPCLTKLRLGHDFNQHLPEGVLPASLSWLILGYTMYYKGWSYRNLVEFIVLPPQFVTPYDAHYDC